MRAWHAILIVSMALLGILTPSTALASAPGHAGTVWAQEDEGGGDNVAPGEQSNEQGDEEGTSGETGAGEGETESGTTETGPPWTYQMARIAIVLLLLTLLGVFAAYWRFVYQRKRAGI